MNRANLWLLSLLMFAVVASADDSLTAKCGKFRGFEVELAQGASKKFEDGETVFSFTYSTEKSDELLFSTSATLHGAAPKWEKLKVLYHSKEQIAAVEINPHGHSVYTLIPSESVVYITTFVHLNGASSEERGSILRAECSFGGKSNT